MAKEELIEFEGLVTEILPDTRYRVKLDTGHEIIAYTAGKMKKNRIKTLAGDRVIVDMSPYDLEKGRIIFRHKDDAPPAPPACAPAIPPAVGCMRLISLCLGRALAYGRPVGRHDGAPEISRSSR